MKMKLNTLTLAIAAAGFIGTAAQAADAVMFPYVVNSATVATLVTVVDRGSSAVSRFNAAGAPATPGSRLHYRMNYKAGAALANTGTCTEINGYLPTSPFDIQTVDLGGKFGATTKGVMFNDPSVNNNWNASGTDYILAPVATLGANRAVLFVHNSDVTNASAQLYGEAMVLEYATGAAWGYQAITSESGDNTVDSPFDYRTTFAVNAGLNDDTAGVTNGILSSVGALNAVLTFMPPAVANTTLFVTPVPNNFDASGFKMLGAAGGNVPGWDRWQTNLNLGVAGGVAYDRDEGLWSGAVPQPVRCVGAVPMTDMVSGAALSRLSNGGWAGLSLTAAGAAPFDGSFVRTNAAYVIKLEFSNGAGAAGLTSGTFNNAFLMR